MDTVKQIQVIETTLKRSGDGVKTPIRRVTQYWSMEGDLLAEVDPINPIEESLNEITKLLDEAAKNGMNITYNGPTMSALRRIAGNAH